MTSRLLCIVAVLSCLGSTLSTPVVPSQFFFSGFVTPLGSENTPYKVALWQGKDVVLDLLQSGTYELTYVTTHTQNCTTVTYNSTSCKIGCWNGGGDCPTRDVELAPAAATATAAAAVRLTSGSASASPPPPPPPPPANVSCACTALSFFAFLPMTTAVGRCMADGYQATNWFFPFPNDAGNVTYCMNGNVPLSMTIFHNPQGPKFAAAAGFDRLFARVPATAAAPDDNVDADSEESSTSEAAEEAVHDHDDDDEEEGPHAHSSHASHGGPHGRWTRRHHHARHHHGNQHEHEHESHDGDSEHREDREEGAGDEEQRRPRHQHRPRHHHEGAMPPPPPPPPSGGGSGGNSSSSDAGGGTIVFTTWDPTPPPSNVFKIPNPCSCSYGL